MDYVTFNLGFHVKYIFNLWCIFFHPAKVLLMYFAILFKSSQDSVPKYVLTCLNPPGKYVWITEISRVNIWGYIYLFLSHTLPCQLKFKVWYHFDPQSLVFLRGYSGVPNKRVGWNKHVGGKISQKLINVWFLINMLVGNNGMKLMQIWSKFLFWE